MSEQKTSIQFYHLTATPLERALPKLLEKAVVGGYRALLLCASDTQIEQLDKLLWIYDNNSFLPHGKINDPQPENQPILLATAETTLNKANLLVVTDGRSVNIAMEYERILDIFDGKDEQAVSLARTRWKEYKDAGYKLYYFRQTEQGSWQKNYTDSN